MIIIHMQPHATFPAHVPLHFHPTTFLTARLHALQTSTPIADRHR